MPLWSNTWFSRCFELVLHSEAAASGNNMQQSPVWLAEILEGMYPPWDEFQNVQYTWLFLTYFINSFFQEYLTVWKKLRPISLGMVNSCTSCASYRTYSGRRCSEFCQGSQCSISISLTCTGWQVSGPWRGLLNIMLCWFLFKSYLRDVHMLLLSFSKRLKRSLLKLTRSTKMSGHFQRHPCKIRLSYVSNETDQTHKLSKQTHQRPTTVQQSIHIKGQQLYSNLCSRNQLQYHNYLMQILLFKAALYSINYPEKWQLKHKTNTQTHKHTQKAEPRTDAFIRHCSLQLQRRHLYD